MDTTNALAALRSLSVADLRRRLAELEAEAQGVRTLLRSAIARERAARRLMPSDDAGDAGKGGAA